MKNNKKDTNKGFLSDNELLRELVLPQLPEIGEVAFDITTTYLYQSISNQIAKSCQTGNNKGRKSNIRFMRGSSLVNDLCDTVLKLFAKEEDYNFAQLDESSIMKYLKADPTLLVGVLDLVDKYCVMEKSLCEMHKVEKTENLRKLQFVRKICFKYMADKAKIDMQMSTEERGFAAKV